MEEQDIRPDLSNSGPHPLPIALPAVGAGDRRDLLDAAIRAYDEAKAMFDRLWARAEDDDGGMLHRCAGTAGVLKCGAERALLRAIPSGDTGPGPTALNFRDVESVVRPARGVVRGKRLYLAIVDPDEADRPVGYRDDDQELMRLAVVGLANVEVLAGDAPPEPPMTA